MKKHLALSLALALLTLEACAGCGGAKTPADPVIGLSFNVPVMADGAPATQVRVSHWDVAAGEIAFEPEAAFTVAGDRVWPVDLWDGGHKIVSGYTRGEFLWENGAYDIRKVDIWAVPHVLYGDDYTLTADGGQGVLTLDGVQYRFPDVQPPVSMTLEDLQQCVLAAAREGNVLTVAYCCEEAEGFRRLCGTFDADALSVTWGSPIEIPAGHEFGLIQFADSSNAAIAGGYLYYGGSDRLECVDLKTGSFVDLSNQARQLDALFPNAWRASVTRTALTQVVGYRGETVIGYADYYEGEVTYSVCYALGQNKLLGGLYITFTADGMQSITTFGPSLKVLRTYDSAVAGFSTCTGAAFEHHHYG